MQSTDPPLPAGAAKVQAFLAGHGADAEVRLLDERTATAAEAASALGTSVSRIGKTIVFGSVAATVAALVCGDDRVDTRRLAAASGGGELAPLAAAEVKRRTGYVIGGVSPFALPPEVVLVADRRLLDFDHCWVAAGHPRAVVRVVPRALVTLCGAAAAEIRVAREAT